MKSSEQVNELAAALAKAQSMIPAVVKHGQSHTGKYATLDDVIATVRAPLADNGLSFVQLPANGEGGVGLTTRLMHDSGQWVEESFTMPAPGGRMNEAQAYGAALTYARRYALSAMLGIATEEDTDANVKLEQPKKQASNGHPPGQVLTLADAEKVRRRFHATGVDCYGDEWDDKRQEFCNVWGLESSNDMTVIQAEKLILGMKTKIAEREEE